MPGPVASAWFQNAFKVASDKKARDLVVHPGDGQNRDAPERRGHLGFGESGLKSGASTQLDHMGPCHQIVQATAGWAEDEKNVDEAHKAQE